LRSVEAYTMKEMLKVDWWKALLVLAWGAIALPFLMLAVR